MLHFVCSNKSIDSLSSRWLRRLPLPIAFGLVATSVLSFPFSFPLSACCETPSAAALGMQNYNAKNYSAAKPQLEMAAKQYPNSAQLQYVLGNTYFQLGEKAKAAQAYDACLAANPTPTIAAYCQKMLSHVRPSGALITSPSSGSGSGVGASSSATSGEGDIETKSTDPAKSKNAERKAEIMKRAEVECAKIRKEKEAQLAEAEANGNRWTRSVEENTVKPGISKEDRAAIDADSEQRIARVMDDAKRRVNALGN